MQAVRADHAVHPLDRMLSAVQRLCRHVRVSSVAIGARKPCLFFQSPHSATDTAVSAIICLRLQQIKLSAVFSAQPNPEQTLDVVHVYCTSASMQKKYIHIYIAEGSKVRHFKEALLLFYEKLRNI